MLKRKTPNPIYTKRDELNEQVQHASSVLKCRVRSTLARTHALNVFPANSYEYKVNAQELEEAKRDVTEWMTVYTMCVRDLNDFCVKNNLRCPEYVSAMQIVLTACELCYRGVQ